MGMFLCFFNRVIGLGGGGDHHHSCWQQEIEAKIATSNGG